MRDTHRITQASTSAWQAQYSRILSRPWVPGVAALGAFLAAGAVAVFHVPKLFLLWPLALVVKALVVEPTQALPRLLPCDADLQVRNALVTRTIPWSRIGPVTVNPTHLVIRVTPRPGSRDRFGTSVLAYADANGHPLIDGGLDTTQAAQAIEWARSNAPLSDHGMSYRLNRPTTILLLLVGATLAGYFGGNAL